MEIPEIQTIKIEGHDEGLQRTDEWFEARRGRFTGSKIKDLMSCSQSVSKIEWGRPEKIIDFSATSKKYIFSKAMERKTGIVVIQDDNKNFKYGRMVEPVIVRRFLSSVKNIKFEESPFLQVKGHEEYLGASPDGKLFGKLKSITSGVEFGFEAKAAMNWETYYLRTEEKINEKQLDFWQLQTEMLALGVNRLYYVTSWPPKSIKEVLQCESEDEIFELVKGIGVVKVEASEIHQKCIIQRAMIANEAIKMFLKDQGSIADCLHYVGTNYDFEEEYNLINNQ